MKLVILGGISALAIAFSATPAAAQAVVGGGIAGNVGDWATSGNVTYSAGDFTQNVDLDLDRTLNSSSVSGFAGNMTIGDLATSGCGCVDYAVYGGLGMAGTSIDANVDVLGNGSVSTMSYNAGLFGGETRGASLITVAFANAGQSSFTSTLDLDFNSHIDADFQQLSWDGTGSGEGFGGALAGGADL